MTAIQYSMTPRGTLSRVAKAGGQMAAKSTRDPELFLTWLVVDQLTEQYCQELRDNLVKIIRQWWECSGGDIINGHFNEELYLKVIEAKKQNGELLF